MTESIGWISLYGNSPSINFFQDSGVDPAEDDRDLNVLLSEVGDIRHIMKSLSDVLPTLRGPKEKTINIYLHDKQYEVLARALLFLTLICETSLAKRERMELFLDLYGNCKIRDKTDAYLQGVINELIQLVTEDERCASVLTELVTFDQLKFKERDELEDIISSYYSTHEYDIEKFRDTRLRAHFKERYDVRKNIADWDYTFYIKKLCDKMNQREYISWRLRGIAFETRLASNNVPNRTFGSYVPGQSVSTADVRVPALPLRCQAKTGSFANRALHVDRKKQGTTSW